MPLFPPCPIRRDHRDGPSTRPKLSPAQLSSDLSNLSDLRDGALGELKGDITASETTIDLRVGVKAVVDAAALLLVKDDLEKLGAILLGAQTLADNLDRVAEVGEDGVVDGGEGARAGALLLLGVARAGRAFGAREDAALGEEEDVTVREFFLKFAGETRVGMLGVVHFIHLEKKERDGDATYRCCTRWKPCRDGTGTKMTIAFLPWPTSICWDQNQHASSRTSLGPLPVLFQRRREFTNRRDAPTRRIAGKAIDQSVGGFGGGSIFFFLISHLISHLTSRAETNCSGRSETLRSAVLVSRSYSAWAMLVSSSVGFVRDVLLAAILLRAGLLMMATDFFFLPMSFVDTARLGCDGIRCVCEVIESFQNFDHVS